MRTLSAFASGVGDVKDMKKIMIFGTFDILHYGHLQLFRRAKRRGDRLIAVVARDANVLKVKGARAFHTEQERKAFLDHIDYIDQAVLGNMDDVYQVIKKIKPDVICLGYDQRVFVENLKEKLKEFQLNAKIVRLKPYKADAYKTSKIKEYLDRMV